MYLFKFEWVKILAIVNGLLDPHRHRCVHRMIYIKVYQPIDLEYDSVIVGVYIDTHE